MPKILSRIALGTFPQVRILETCALWQTCQRHIQAARFHRCGLCTLHKALHLKLQDLQPLTQDNEQDFQTIIRMM